MTLAVKACMGVMKLHKLLHQEKTVYCSLAVARAKTFKDTEMWSTFLGNASNTTIVNGRNSSPVTLNSLKGQK